MLGHDQLARVMQASDTRAHYAGLSGGKRRVCVHDAHVLESSRELVEAFNPATLPSIAPLVVSNEIEPLISLLPADVAASLSGFEQELSDIQLDKGRRPQAWCAGRRIFLGEEDPEVCIDEINDIVGHLGGQKRQPREPRGAAAQHISHPTPVGRHHRPHHARWPPRGRQCGDDPGPAFS